MPKLGRTWNKQNDTIVGPRVVVAKTIMVHAGRGRLGGMAMKRAEIVAIVVGIVVAVAVAVAVIVRGDYVMGETTRNNERAMTVRMQMMS